MTQLPEPLVNWCERVTGLLVQSPAVPAADKQQLVRDLDGILRRGGVYPKTRYKLQQMANSSPPPADGSTNP